MVNHHLFNANMWVMNSWISHEPPSISPHDSMAQSEAQSPGECWWHSCYGGLCAGSPGQCAHFGGNFGMCLEAHGGFSIEINWLEKVPVLH